MGSPDYNKRSRKIQALVYFIRLADFMALDRRS
jgi:hypothetical protein